MKHNVHGNTEGIRDALLQHIPTLKSVRVQAIGPVIGAHCGPGTIAVSFEGKLNPVEG